jgi:alkylation response protein AidB-like acyl-CoA dehydrogenase
MTVELQVKALIEQDLKPLVVAIDKEGLYPREFIQKLGHANAFDFTDLNASEALEKALAIIEEVTCCCGSTGFSLWCHTTAINYLLYSNNHYLKKEVLPELQQGKTLGGTGLSNPMKYYAAMERLRLQGHSTEDGYIVKGCLPFVSNLHKDHWVGIIFEVDINKRVMAFIPCATKGITLKNPYDFIGLNGTGTYQCNFENVFIKNQWIISEDADTFVDKIKIPFIINQIGMALGLISASIKLMKQSAKKQNGVNKYLYNSIDDYIAQYNSIKEQILKLVKQDNISIKDVLTIRLKAAEITLDAAQTAFLSQGAAGYFRCSDASRVLREAYFLAIVSPAVKHLKKLLADLHP